MNDDFRITDKLAHAYGWSVEYISSLGIEEITGLIKAISEREDTERKILSYTILLAVNGKTIDNIFTNASENISSKKDSKKIENTQLKQDETNIKKLFQSGIVDKIEKSKEK